MKLSDRVAVSECIRLVELLLLSTTPHAGELGLIVMARVAEIARNGAGPVLDDEDAEKWCEFAKQHDVLADADELPRRPS